MAQQQAAGTGAKGFGASTIVERPAGTGAVGFVFEELMDQTLRHLVQPLASKGISSRILNEQQIRDEFGEQSLNGVDHFVALSWNDGKEMLFLIQEKWKFVTNQREVSQFLDCCARILARMPDYKGQVVRLWVTRTQPTANGEKSLSEGGAYVVQCSTSMCFLAQITGQFICEMLGDRTLCQEMIATMPHLLSGDTPPPAEPKQPLTAGHQQKDLPAGAGNPSKLKVVVIRKE
jgi:hypothetical protein